jgi:hypothetical protein
MFLSISNKPILKQVPVHKLNVSFKVSIFIMVHRIPLILLEHVIEYVYLALPSKPIQVRYNGAIARQYSES